MAASCAPCERVDDLRLRVVLERPWAPLLSALALPPFSIVSPTAMRLDVDSVRQWPVGTGPFTFAGWSGDDLELTTNAAYWGAPPRVARVRFRVIEDSESQLAALRAGSVQLVEQSDADGAAAAKRLTNVKVVLRPSQSVVSLSINQNADPFGEKPVRQALAYAVNRKAIVEKAYAGMAQIADDFTPPALSGPNTEPVDLYNRALASATLSDAGFGGSVMTQLWYPSRPRPLLPNPRTVAEMIAADLRAVGVVVSLNSADWPTYQRKALDGAYPLYLQGWIGDTPDPDSYLTPLFAGDTVTRSIGYNSPELRALLTLGRETTGDAERQATYSDANKTIRDDMPRVPLVYPQTPVLVAVSVKGFVPSALGFESYRNVSVSRF